MLPNDMPNANEPQPEPSIPAQPVAPEPQYATREDLAKVVEGLQAMSAALQQGFATREAAPQPAAVAEPTDEEIITELNNGKTTNLRKIISSVRESLIKQHIEPMQVQGLSNFAAIARSQAANNPAMPYFKEYEKEIDKLVANVPLAQRADPACYTTAYNMVIGMNHNVIMAKEREKILRENGGSVDGSVPSTQRRDSSTQPGVPTVAEVLGPEAQREMDNWGWTPDEMVQRLYSRTMKVKTWAEAAPLIRAQNEALRSGNA